jgi:hypothetical protein
MIERELKFRIYAHIDKAFIYFDIEDYPSGIAMGVSAPQQFTGILDSENKEIYEGDIVTLGATYPLWVVSYNSRCARFEAGYHQFNTNTDGSVNSRDLRVIGNIIEHRHLIN